MPVQNYSSTFSSFYNITENEFSTVFYDLVDNCVLPFCKFFTYIFSINFLNGGVPLQYIGNVGNCFLSYACCMILISLLKKSYKYALNKKIYIIKYLLDFFNKM